MKITFNPSFIDCMMILFLFFMLIFLILGINIPTFINYSYSTAYICFLYKYFKHRASIFIIILYVINYFFHFFAAIFIDKPNAIEIYNIFPFINLEFVKVFPILFLIWFLYPFLYKRFKLYHKFIQLFLITLFLAHTYMEFQHSIYGNYNDNFIYYCKNINLNSKITAQDYAALYYYPQYEGNDFTDYDYIPDGLPDPAEITFHIDDNSLSSTCLGCLAYNGEFYSPEDPIPDHVVKIVKDLTTPIIKRSNHPIIDLSHLITLSEENFR